MQSDQTFPEAVSNSRGFLVVLFLNKNSENAMGICFQVGTPLRLSFKILHENQWQKTCFTIIIVFEAQEHSSALSSLILKSDKWTIIHTANSIVLL